MRSAEIDGHHDVGRNYRHPPPQPSQCRSLSAGLGICGDHDIASTYGPNLGGDGEPRCFGRDIGDAGLLQHDRASACRGPRESPMEQCRLQRGGGGELESAEECVRTNDCALLLARHELDCAPGLTKLGQRLFESGESARAVCRNKPSARAQPALDLMLANQGLDIFARLSCLSIDAMGHCLAISRLEIGKSGLGHMAEGAGRARRRAGTDARRLEDRDLATRASERQRR